jgi:hypothetical protein
LAKSAGLSRVTINQLENGTLVDLGFAKLKAVLDLLSISLQTNQRTPMSNALGVAARSISTSYKETMSKDALASALQSGKVDPKYHAHIMAFLDETPLPLALGAVTEAATAEVPPKKIVKNLSRWAKEWKACRTVWL